MHSNEHIARDYARAFSGVSGRAVIAHLRAMTVERRMGLDATDAQLRWVAAQAALVHQIEQMITRGQET